MCIVHFASGKLTKCYIRDIIVIIIIIKSERHDNVIV